MTSDPVHPFIMSATVVFSIVEILRIICTFLEDDKKTSTSFATCNKAASNTILEVLWAKLDSFEPLMPFVPGQLREAPSAVSTRCGLDHSI